MKFTESQIDELRSKVGGVLSIKRFSHTRGVEAAAIRIAEKCLPGFTDEIIAAALLHDISKEKSEAELLDSIKSRGFKMSESDMMCPSVWHSIDAPGEVLSSFNEFATDEILSAVFNHTVGAPDMSVFDEIIFVADYIESGREYTGCADVRNALYADFERAVDVEECIQHLHRATIAILENTIAHVIGCGKFLHEKTVMTRNAFLGRFPLAVL